MYIFSVEEAQKDLAKILEMVANGKDVAISGKHPALLHGVLAVGNLSGGNRESRGSIIIGHSDDDVQNDELVKPLSDDIIESFYAPRIYDASTPESR
jgi:hypothetical protein